MKSFVSTASSAGLSNQTKMWGSLDFPANSCNLQVAFHSICQLLEVSKRQWRIPRNMRRKKEIPTLQLETAPCLPSSPKTEQKMHSKYAPDVLHRPRRIQRQEAVCWAEAGGEILGLDQKNSLPVGCAASFWSGKKRMPRSLLVVWFLFGHPIPFRPSVGGKHKLLIFAPKAERSWFQHNSFEIPEKPPATSGIKPSAA